MITNATTVPADVQAALVQTATQIVQACAAAKPSKVDALRKKQKQLTEQIRLLENKESTKRRREEARDMIIIGRCVEQWAKRDWGFSAELRRELEKFVTRPADRMRLGLTVAMEKKNVG